MALDNENLVVEREKIIREEAILSPEKEQEYLNQIADLKEENAELKLEHHLFRKVLKQFHEIPEFSCINYAPSLILTKKEN